MVFPVLPALAVVGSIGGSALSYNGKRQAARSQARQVRRSAHQQGLMDMAQRTLNDRHANQLHERNFEELERRSDFIRDVGHLDLDGAQAAEGRLAAAMDQARQDAGVRQAGDVGEGNAYARSLAAAMRERARGQQARNAVRVHGAGRQHLAEGQRQAGSRESFERRLVGQDIRRIGEEQALEQSRLQAVMQLAQMLAKAAPVSNSAHNQALAGDILGAVSGGLADAYGEGANVSDLLGLIGLGGNGGGGGGGGGGTRRTRARVQR